MTCLCILHRVEGYKQNIKLFMDRELDVIFLRSIHSVNVDFKVDNYPDCEPQCEVIRQCNFIIIIIAYDAARNIYSLPYDYGLLLESRASV